MRELHCPAIYKTEQKLALGGWHIANALALLLDLATSYGIGDLTVKKKMIIGKVIFEISRKYDVHNNYETDYRLYSLDMLQTSVRYEPDRAINGMK